MQEIYEKMLRDSQILPEKEEDLYSKMLRDSKLPEQPDIEELELPEIEKKEPPFLQKIKGFGEKLLPAILGPQRYADVILAPQLERAKKEALMKAPEKPEMRALTPEEEARYERGPEYLARGEELERAREKPWKPEVDTRLFFDLVGGFYQSAAFASDILDKYSHMLSEATGLERGGIFESLSKDWDLYAQYFQEKGMPEGIPKEVATGVGGAAFDIPTIMAFGQFGLPIHGAIYGGAEEGVEGATAGAVRGMLIHKSIQGLGMLPSKFRLPGWAGFGAAISPGGVEERVAGALTWAALGLSGGNRRVTIEEFLDRYPKIKDKISEKHARKILKELNRDAQDPQIDEAGGAKAVLDESFKTMLEISEKIGKPEEWMKPEYGIKRPSELMPPAEKIATEEGVVYKPGVPEAEVLKARYREAEPKEAVVNIMPKADGSVDVTIPRPTEPAREIVREPEAKIAREMKAPVFKEPLYQAIFNEGGIRPNPDYSRSELLEVFPPRLIKSANDPRALAMDEMADTLKADFPRIEYDVDLHAYAGSLRRAPKIDRAERAERERIDREYEEFEDKRAAEARKEAREEYVERWEKTGFEPPEKAPPRTLEQQRAYAKEMIKGKTTEQLKEILPDLEFGERSVVEKEIKAREEKPIELYKMPPAARKIEKLFREGKLSAKELTAEEKEYLKERGIYEEGKPPPKAKLPPEPEIEKVAEKPVLTKISVKDPTGKVETFEITEDRIGRIREYAKNLGILEEVEIGKPYAGRWKEHYSPSEHEKTIKQFLREVKSIPKEEWELYSGYPLTKEVKVAVERVQERLKTKRRIKLEELKEELQKTEEGKVEWMYLESERMLKEKRKPTFKKAFRGAKRALVDTSGNIKKDLIKNLGPLGKEAATQHELIAGASGKAQRLIEEAKKRIYKGISRNDESLLNRAIQSRRTIAISKYKPEVKHPFGLTEKEHLDYMKTIPEEINKRADRYFKEMEKVVDVLESEGLITSETAGYLKSKGDYSPRRFIQHIDPESTYVIGGKTITVPDSGIKALDEGSYNVMETNSRLLLESVISRTQARAFRNRANNAAYEIADSFPDNGIFKKAKVYKTTKEGKPVYQKAPAGHTKIKVMIKGEAKEIIMPDEYAREWIQRDPLITQTMAEIIGWASGTRPLKAMATGYNPGFTVTNMPRDIGHLWIVTSEYSSFLPKYVFQIAKDLRATKKDAFLRKGEFIDYVDEGGMMTFLTHQGRLFKNPIKEIKTAQKVLGYAGETSEIWTRLALRRRAIRNEKAPYEATFIARNYLDFFQGGSVIKALDAGFPYLNAGVQGTRGIFRALADRPVQTLWKFAQLGALASGLYLAANYASEEVKECYDHIPDRDKVNNFCIGTPWKITDKSGNERWFYFKIAKDQGQRVICSIFENLMAKALGKEINADQISQSVQEFIPIIPTETLPPSLDAMMGYMANKDFWTREDIWKGGKEILPREEYTDYTHPALVKAGKVTEMSPDRLGYALNQIFTRGNIYTSMVGAGLTMAMRSQPKEERKKTTAEILERLPIIRRVFRLTPPYSEKELKALKKVEIEESTRRYRQKRELSGMARRYYGKLKDEKIKDQSILDEARDFIKKQPMEDRKRLAAWFRNYGRIHDVPNRLWWLDLSEMPPEARATVFWTKYVESEEKERKEMKILGKKIPGLWSDRFLKRLQILINKWKRESE